MLFANVQGSGLHKQLLPHRLPLKPRNRAPGIENNGLHFPACHLSTPGGKCPGLVVFLYARNFSSLKLQHPRCICKKWPAKKRSSSYFPFGNCSSRGLPFRFFAARGRQKADSSSQHAIPLPFPARSPSSMPAGGSASVALRDQMGLGREVGGGSMLFLRRW